MGLYDAFLIKENHIAACSGIARATQLAGQIGPGKPVEVEVENLEEFEQALNAKAECVMPDNFSAEQIEAAISLHRQCLNKHRMEIEISGNVTNAEIQQLNGLPVDYISTGALTKHCRAIDYSMRIADTIPFHANLIASNLIAASHVE